MRGWLNVSPGAARMARAVKARGTSPELALRAALRRAGFAGRYRVNDRRLPGSPDMAFPRAEVALFVDGDFWHGRAWFERGRLPRNNRALWRAKFERNRARDRRDDAALRALGWAVVRVWVSDLARDPGGVADALGRFVEGRSMRGAACGFSARSGELHWRAVPNGEGVPSRA
ncbi:MAG: DNA mismatch endonuclease Vsr [Gemmatimonadetes bacterium]|nr:DNA mismatch endonuclease Vsr [Gemmatimonadota bacterium]